MQVSDCYCVITTKWFKIKHELDSTFALSKEKGIISFRDLFLNGRFVDFASLSHKHYLPQSNFFRYLQVRSFIKDHCSTFPRLPADLPDILNRPENWKKMISKLYTSILQANPSPQITAKQGWEKELGVHLQDPWWERAKMQVNSSSSCARLYLMQMDGSCPKPQQTNLGRLT